MILKTRKTIPILLIRTEPTSKTTATIPGKGGWGGDSSSGRHGKTNPRRREPEKMAAHGLTIDLIQVFGGEC
jgi:hypothetical protein